MRITVAVSGGADRLFALLRMQAKSLEVRAAHALFADTPSALAAVSKVKDLCSSLGIHLELLDLRKYFHELVINPFIAAHTSAHTPNPCAICNREMKFGLLWERIISGIDDDSRLATGHYARLDTHPVYGKTLRTGADKSKDQSYFIALVPIERLRTCIFPLGYEQKKDILSWLAANDHHSPIPGESQEICFIPDDNHLLFLEKFQRTNPGPIILYNPPTPTGPLEPKQTSTLGGRQIGYHQGLWRYTEGQRKGLGVTWREPLFVIARDTLRNALIVAPREWATQAGCSARDVNFLVAPELWPQELFVRTRYRHPATPANIEVQGRRILITHNVPQEPVAPGQIAAVYDHEGFLLAGGILE